MGQEDSGKGLGRLVAHRRTLRITADPNHLDDLMDDSMLCESDYEQADYNASIIEGWRTMAYVARVDASDTELDHERARLRAQPADADDADFGTEKRPYTVAALNEKLNIALEGIFSVEYYEHAMFARDVLLDFLKKPDVAVTASTYDFLRDVLDYVDELPYEEPEQFGLEPRRRRVEQSLTERKIRELLREEEEYLEAIIEGDALSAHGVQPTKPYTTKDLSQAWKRAQSKFEDERKRVEAEGGPKRVTLSSLPILPHPFFKRLLDEQCNDRYL